MNPDLKKLLADERFGLIVAGETIKTAAGRRELCVDLHIDDETLLECRFRVPDAFPGEIECIGQRVVTLANHWPTESDPAAAAGQPDPRG